MQKIYTYLAVMLAVFGVGEAAMAQCSNLNIIVNGTTYTSRAGARDVVNLTINQGENVTLTHSSGAFTASTQYVWNASTESGFTATGAPLPRLINSQNVVDGDVMILPTASLTPCTYPIYINLGQGSFCNNGGTAAGILLNLTVRSRINVSINGAQTALTTAGVTLGSASCLAFSTTNSTATNWAWDFGGTTASTQAMPLFNVTPGAYSLVANFTNANVLNVPTTGNTRVCPAESYSIPINIAQSGISVTGMSFSGTTASPSSYAVTVPYGEPITLTNAAVVGGTGGSSYRWYAGRVGGALHDLANGTSTLANSVFNIPTTLAGNELTPCTYVITVTMMANTTDLSCDQGNAIHLEITANVVNVFTLATIATPVAPYTGPVSLPLGDDATLSIQTPFAGAQYAWSLNGQTSVASSLPNVNLPSGTYVGNGNVINPACATAPAGQSQVYDISVQDGCGMALLGNNYYGTVGSPANGSVTIAAGADLTFTELGSSNNPFVWATTFTPAVAGFTPATGPNGTYVLNTSALQPCSYNFNVNLSSNNGSCLVAPAATDYVLDVIPNASVNGTALGTGTTITICRGSNLSLSTPSITGASYEWTFDSGLGPIQTFFDASPTAITGLGVGSYAVTLEVTHPGCVGSTTRSFAVVVEEAPAISAAISGGTPAPVQGGLVSICEGEDIVFAALSTPTSYRWSVSGTTSSAATFTMTNVQTGTYAGRVTLTNGSATACAAAVQVIDFAVNAESRPQGLYFSSSVGTISNNILSVCGGTTGVQITANCPGGSCPLTSAGYVWNKGTANEHVGPIYTTNIPLSGSTTLDIELTNSYGASGCSSDYSLVVQALAKPSLAINVNPSSAVVCSGDTISLSPSNTSNLTFIWSQDTAVSGASYGLQGTTFASVNAIPTNNNNNDVVLRYNVLATNTFGCSQIFSRNITVRPVWRGTINLDPLRDLCESETLELTAECSQGCDNVDYEWVDDISGQVISSTNQTGTAPWVTQVLASTLPSDSVDILLYATHDNGCVTTLYGPGVQQVWRNPGINLVLTPSGSTCPGTPITATVNTSYPPDNGVLDYNYTWNGGTPTSSSNQRIYSFTTTADISVRAFYNPVPEVTCEARDTETINIPSLGAMSLTLSDNRICKGSAVTIQPNITSSFTPVLYQWGSNLDPSVSNLTTASINVSPVVSTEYRLTVTNSDSCKLYADTTILVDYSPSVTIIDPGTPLCPSRTKLRTSVAGGLPSYTYLWTASGGAPGALNSDTLMIDISSTAINLTLEVTDQNGCVGNASASIATRDCGPELQLLRTLYKAEYCENDTLKLIAVADPATFANPTFQWSTGRIKSNVGQRDTLIINPPLTDESFNVIVSNGAPDFTVKEILLGPSGGSRNKITFNNDVPDFTAAGPASDGLKANPSLVSNSNNSLYNTSILEIVIERTAGNVPEVEAVIFDNKYQGRIISQTNPILALTTTNNILVQVPCMLATKPVGIVLRTTTGQIKRITKCVYVEEVDLPAPPPVVFPSGERPIVVTANRTIGAGFPDPTNIEGNFFKREVEYTINSASAGIQTLNFDLAYTFAQDGPGNNGLTTVSFTYASSRAEDTVQVSNDYNGGAARTGTFYGLTQGDFPLTVTYPGTTGSKQFVRDGLTINIINTSGTTLPGIATVTDAADPTLSTTLPSFTIASVSFTNATISTTSSNNGSYGLRFALPTLSTTMVSIPTVPGASVTSTPTPTATITHINTERDSVRVLDFGINAGTPNIIGLKARAFGPSAITNVAFSDFFADYNQTVLDAGTDILLPGVSLAAPARTTAPTSTYKANGGNTGHVCLYEMTDANGNPSDRVYISTSATAITNSNTGAGGAPDEIGFDLIINRPELDTVFASLDTICAEEDTRIYVESDPTKIVSYTWQSNPSSGLVIDTLLAASNVDSIVASPYRTTRYIVEGTSLYGCKVKDSLTIFVNPLPGTRITPNDTSGIARFCPSGSATLFAVADSITCAGNCVYSWEAQRNGSWVPVGSAVSISRSFEENLRLSISANGCADSDSITLEKYPLPEVAIEGPNLRVLCAGAPITLSVDSVYAGFSYLWNTTTTFPDLTVNTQGGYYVQATDTNGCTALSEPVMVINTTEGQNTVITANPQVICSPAVPAQLAATPCLSCNYTWYYDAPSYVQQLMGPLPSRFYNATAIGDYFVEVTNRYGCTFRSTNLYHVVSVNSAPSVITATSTSICIGSQAVLGTQPIPGYQYQWYKDNVILSAQTTNQITVTTPGQYSLYTTFSNGCGAFSNTITINSTSFTPALDSSGTIICNGSFVTLSTALLPAATYQWYLNGVAIPNATGSAYDATAAGNYYVRVTNSQGCSANTNTRTLNVSSIDAPVASTNKTAICPEDLANLSVTLCPGCQYQWFRNGVALTTTPSSTNYTPEVALPGAYNVRVSTPATGCSQLSNTIIITQQNAPIPSVAAPIQELCGGINPVLQTTSCVGCDYTWLYLASTTPDTLFQPIFGALNDTAYTVTSLGVYSVQVAYPNGCIVKSTQQVVIDGSFTTSLSNLSNDTICNNSAITFNAQVTPASRCTGGCSYQWFRNGSLLQTTASPSYSPPINQRLGGVYQVRVTTPTGCQSNSNLDTVSAITLQPIVTASAAAICGNTPVTLTTVNCPGGCNTNYTYLWSNGATTSAISTSASASYVATVSLNSVCSATTPPVALNPLAPLGTTIGVNVNGTVTAMDTASICAGDSVRLDLLSGCTACTYQWVRGTSAAFADVPTATLNNYSTNLPNGYALIANDTSNNCRDTSNFIVLRAINAYPGFGLNFGGTTLAASGAPVDLDNLNPGLTPAVPLYSMGQYSTIPLFAYNPPTVNPGLNNSSTRRDTFSPGNALPGNYLITYTYTDPDSSCVFTTSDVLVVQNAAEVEIDNLNPMHVPYEACVSDSVVIRTTNYAFAVANVQLFNQVDAYTTVSIASVVTNTDTLAADVIYHQEITIVIPDWAKGSFVRLVGPRHGGAADSSTTQFLLIHNEPLALSGLPATICSNGSPIALTGTPAGGTFILQKYFANPVTAADSLQDTTAISGVFSGTILSPTSIPLSQYDANGIDTMRVVYRFYSRFSNGNYCPQPDTATMLVEGRNVTLSQVRFNPISVSQTRERLDNLVKRVNPHSASPSRWLIGAPANGHEIIYGGSFTTPAGAPEEFLPANAGVGTHTLSYTIKNGVCLNTVSDVIQVLPAPTPVAVADTICRNIAPITFSRDPALAYQANSLQFIQAGVTFADTFNTLVVTSADTSRYITVLNSNPGLEQFRYQPQAPDTVLTHDTLLVRYIYSRVEYNNGAPFDTTTYVIASFYQPIFIEDTTLVNILDTLLSPVICENNTDVLVAATPSGGIFTLQGGTGAYASGDTLVNNILNSYVIHQNETANTNYVLTYTLNGVACRSRDTFNFLIPMPLDPTFQTASGNRTYCNSAVPDPIVANTTGNFTNVLLVNGVAQPTMHFTPTLAIPGPQIVINEVTDADYGCITTYRDSFHVYPLPVVRIDTFAVREFCTNDSSFQFAIHPAPTCLGATGGERITEGFNSQTLPANWGFINANSASSGWGQYIVNGLSVAFVDTTSIAQNAWLYTPAINMVSGSTYQIEYLLRVGPRNCQTCADASMAVTVGQGQTPGAQATVLATYPTLDDNYAGFYTLRTHSFIAPASGNFNFAFHANSLGRTTRWIAIDTVIVREITAGNCLTGIGSLSGPGIVNTPGNDSLYTFVPTTIAAGNHTIRYSFSDTRGCIDSVVVPIEVKPHPTVAMGALDSVYCWNELPVAMSGTPVGGVFTSTRLSGPAANNMTIGGVAVNNVTYNTSVPLRFTPRNVGLERFEYRYRDPLTQCATSVFDTVRVVNIPDSARFLARVNAPTDPNALLDIYCQTHPAVTLNVEPVRGTPQPGFFYGAGVLNGAGGPGVAQIHMDSAVAAMHRVGNDTLTYVYTTTNGCQDTTRFVTRIEPIPTLSFDLAPVNVRLPDSICLNDPALGVQVRHQQWTGPLGDQFIDTMIIFGAGTMTASALQIGDTINPMNFGAGYHPVSYYFRNVYGCENTIYDTFRVDTVPVVYFTGLPPSRSYCENDQGGLLLAYPAYYPGSGYLQLGNRIIDSNFVYIDPAQLADPTQTVVYNIYYTFTNLQGCTDDGTDSIEIRPFPRINFTLDSVYCNQDDTLDLYTGVTPTGGVFTDNLPVTSIIQGRYFNLNSAAGPRRIIYQYTDPITACTNVDTQQVTLYHTPSVSFVAAGGCQGVDVVFEGTLANLDAAFDSITQVIWNFGDGNSAAMIPTDPVLVPDTMHTYTTHGYMNTSLTVINRGICSTTVYNNLTVSPTIVLDRYLPPYVQDFEASNGFWYPEQEQVTAITDTVWSHRLLLNGHIVDPSNKAWVTYANQAPYIYGAGHRAHIYSPCFDFSRTWRPMISMDVWRDMNPGVDGAVLEYYDAPTREWKVVGEMNAGIRWYQSNFLLARPGGQRNTTQPTGWSGYSEGWDNVRYRLDQFAGQPSVRFRIAFATASNTVLVDQPQGFAFDSVWIGERGRNVLVEHFTNYVTPNVFDIEQGLYDKIFNNIYGRDITMIQYHIPLTNNSASLSDQYYLDNQPDPVTRAYDMGIQATDRALVDGLPRGDGTTMNLDVRELELDMLQFPAFDIFIDPIVINGNDVTVNSTVLALQPMDYGDYAIMTAILEDSLPNQMIDQNSMIYPLMGVMRKLMPNNSGRNYSGAWTQGQTLSFSETETLTTAIPSNPALLHAAVFIQNRNTQDVYQVATTRDLTIYAYDSLTNVVPGQPNQVTDETSSMRLYPNPASNYFNVEFEQTLQSAHDWQLVDVLGRVIQTGKAQPGTRQIQVNTEQLSAAPYFFVIRNATVYTQRQVIITKP